MLHRDRKSWLKSLGLAIFVFMAVAACGRLPFETGDRAYHHLVVLGDPHLPGRSIEVKEQAIATINSWHDVEMVVAVGDICVDFGTEAEYKAAKDFFAGLDKPLTAITGNHDYVYADPHGSENMLVTGTQATKEEKLRRFGHTFGLTSLYHSRQVGEYLLIFLSADHMNYLAGLSDEQLAWLRQELERNRQTPTIIFFHAPLQGTLRNYRHWVNTPGFVAQPADTLHEILVANQQVFLWVSGHTHTPPTEESYASEINLYAGQITNIHNKDMNRGQVWTNSLFLYPGKVLVKTYSHQENDWMPQFDRLFSVPEL